MMGENNKVLVNQELRCSRYIWFLTYLMIAFPVTYLVFAGFVFELPSKGVLAIALSPLFYVTSIFWIMAGVGLRRLHQWSWYAFITAEFFMAYLNLLNLTHYSNSGFKVWAFGLSMLVQVYLFVAVKREIRVAYLFPHIKWWESGIAGMPQIEVKLHHLNDVKGDTAGFILDIDSKGCFIKTHHDFEPFERVTISVHAFGQTAELHGWVMWCAKSTVTHPKGIGVRFAEMNRQNKRRVRVISQRFLHQKEPSHAKLPA